MTQFLLSSGRILGMDTLTKPCKLWTGRLTKDGYGRLHNKGGDLVHRIAYVLEHGPESLPPGYEVDHLCRVRNCYEITHLEGVLVAENRRRAAAVMLTCRKGHPFSPENTRYYQPPSGRRGMQRVCRACQSEHQARYRKRRNES